MKAELLVRARVVLREGAFAELVVWRVPRPVRGSRHGLKYRLAYIVNGKCLVRMDNEAGKGDHVHLRGEERPYVFRSPETLLQDFWRLVEELEEDRR